MEQNFSWLCRGTVEIFPQPSCSESNTSSFSKGEVTSLEKTLEMSDRPLRIKLGIDPTGADIHLGHSIPVRKLRAFQDAGHIAVLIIGDFTAQIGDPSGKSDTRRHLSSEQVAENAKTYLQQIKQILDFDTPGRLELRYNSEWLTKINLSEIIHLLSTMTVGQMLAKEGFAERYHKENPIFLHEFLYPLMQGYDSVAVDADVELGGTDQKFNIAVGRDLQRFFGKKPQFGLLLPILLGTDGVQKMSKSLNNYVGLLEHPLQKYQKLQAVHDSLLGNYFELLTDLPLDELPENPRDCQKLLGWEIIRQYHGVEAADEAQKSAESGGQKGDLPEFSLIGVGFPAKLFHILNLSNLCKSSSEGKRKIKEGGVKIDGERVTDIDITFEQPSELQGRVLQLGKNKFVRLVLGE
ncbi:Tyrosyl-tRNA synthetase [Richelia intracellularis HH01]|uniref:Tyrosine--tRNA ligase n=1 Tax=Richelia intracellularis HH01 TaxID=1165094 RepID=M1X6D8_9NOST|nr:tyrosine--tRNA ligase [Richelia intracellularis]CCH68066.1 Tyrosyl-tRNA synthetase [Richelia intracellularis HH01]HAE05275.1 tyrosine--tRNA ligase [Richelia sp.]